MAKNNRQIQQERDRKILEFIDEFQSARTSTIHELFFIKEDGTHTITRITRDRLAKLEKDGQLKRDRESINHQYYYYIRGRKPSSQRKHTLITTDFYRELHKLEGVKIHAFSKIKINDIVPDSVIAFSINGKVVYGFLEVELSNKKFDIEKYQKFKRKKEYESMGLKEMPVLIVVTNKRKIPDTHGIEIIKIRTDLSDIENVLKI